MATKPKGGGGLKALVAGPLRKEPFFAASLNNNTYKYMNWLIDCLFGKAAVNSPTPVDHSLRQHAAINQLTNNPTN